VPLILQNDLPCACDFYTHSRQTVSPFCGLSGVSESPSHCVFEVRRLWLHGRRPSLPFGQVEAIDRSQGRVQGLGTGGRGWHGRTGRGPSHGMLMAPNASLNRFIISFHFTPLHFISRAISQFREMKCNAMNPISFHVQRCNHGFAMQ